MMVCVMLAGLTRREAALSNLVTLLPLLVGLRIAVRNFYQFAVIRQYKATTFGFLHDFITKILLPTLALGKLAGKGKRKETEEYDDSNSYGHHYKHDHHHVVTHFRLFMVFDRGVQPRSSVRCLLRLPRLLIDSLC